MVDEEKFCGKCGHPLKAALKPVFEENTWRARPGEFAARVRMPDPKGFFERLFASFKEKRLVVAPGTKAVVFEDGKNVDIIDPGEYTLDSFLSRFNRFFQGKHISIILYNDGDLELLFNIKGCSTKEGLAVEVKSAIDVRIENAALFAARLMGHDDVFNVIQLRGVLFRRIEICLKGAIRQCGIDELRHDMSLQNTFDQALETALKEFLPPLGIAFSRVRAFDFTHPVYDEMQERKGMLHLQVDATKTMIEHKKVQDDLNHEIDKQSYRREAQKQEVEKMKAGLKQTGEEQDLALAIDRFEKIEKAELALRNSKEINKANADVELRIHADKIRQEQLLRDSDMKAIELTLAEKNVGAQMKVEKALKILKDACDKEFQIAQAASQHQLDMARFDHEEELLKRTDERLARELSVQIQRDRVIAQNGHRTAMEQLLHDVDIRKITREEEAKDGDARRGQTLLDAQTNAAVEDIGRAGRAKDWDAELGKLQGLMSLDADKARQEAELREKEEAAKHARTLDVLDRDAKREMDLLAAGSEAEVRRAQAYAGYDAEQLLALKADGAGAAEALKAKFAAQGTEEAAAREREAHDKAMTREESRNQQAMQMMQGMSEKMIDKMGAVAMAQAQGISSAANASAAAAASASVAARDASGGGSAPEAKVTLKRCLGCSADNDSASDFCTNCGKELK
jgi:hypothetical protein